MVGQWLRPRACSPVDLSDRIPSLQQRSRQGHSLLKRSRTAIASADRVLLASWMSWFEGQGPLVAACTSEDACLEKLQQSDATLLLCTDNLEGGSGTNLVRRAREQHPDLKVLMLLQRPIPRTILDAIDARCHGLCSAPKPRAPARWLQPSPPSTPTGITSTR